VNVQVPSGLTDGDDVYIEFASDAADIDQIQIPYGTSSSVSDSARSRRAIRKRLLRHGRLIPHRAPRY